MSSLMQNCRDFIDWLGLDTSTKVLTLLDDPSDLVRASAVSRSWRHFVVANGFCKKLCHKISPDVSIFARTEINSSLRIMEVGSSNDMEWVHMERDHRVYGYLGYCLISRTEKKDCILQSLWASSTDNYPEEGIENTLESVDRTDTRPSYWSSKGTDDPGFPESLTYKLHSICIVREIKIRPFKAFFQPGHPIYSAKFVRFRMGYSRSPQQKKEDKVNEHGTSQEPCRNNYIWTYVSPEFPMIQENILQSFKLPRPVICIGGILQIELLSRIQKHDMDKLYYFCMCHVQAIGTQLLPVFDADVVDIGGPVLQYFPESRSCILPSRESGNDVDEPGLNSLASRIRRLRGRAWARAWNRVIFTALRRTITIADEDENNHNDNPEV